MRLGHLVPLIALLAALPACAVEAPAAAPIEAAASPADLAPLAALLARAEAVGLPALDGGTILTGTVTWIRKMEGGNTWQSQLPCLALRDGAGGTWIGGALPVPTGEGIDAAWKPRTSGERLPDGVPPPFFAAIQLTRLAQLGDAAAWARLASFVVHREGSLPLLPPADGPNAGWWRQATHPQDLVALDRREALAHALVLWGLRCQLDAPIGQLPQLEAFIAAVAPPRLAAWAAGEAALRHRARSAPAAAPVAVGTADDAALVALLADALPLAVALPGFDGLGSVGSCPRVADAAANELVRRWWVLPADLVHHQAWWAGFLFGPRIAPEPSAADTIAVLRTRLLAPGSETTAERIAALLAEGPADPLIGLLPALDPESRVTETSGQVPRQDLRRALADRLARAWTKPPALDPAQTLLLVRVLGAEPAAWPLLDAWPWTAADAPARALHEERRGHPEATDALVVAGLASDADPSADPLAPWLDHPSAQRVDRLLALMADPADPIGVRAWLGLCRPRMRSAAGKDVPAALETLAFAHLLTDERLLAGGAATVVLAALVDEERERAAYLLRAAGMRPARQPSFATGGLPAGTRVCDAVLGRTRTWIGTVVDMSELQTLFDEHPVGFDPRDPQPARDAARLALRRLLAPHVQRAAESLHWTPPPALLDLPPEPPVLADDEAAALRAVLAEAEALGFPRLAGASVRQGRLPGGDADETIHVRLADGRWLRGGDGAPVDAAIELPVSVLREPQGRNYALPGEMTNRLPGLAPRLGKVRGWRPQLMWPRDGAWSSGAILAAWAATTERSAPLDTALLAVLVMPAEEPRLWPRSPVDLDYGRRLSNPPPVVDEVAGLLRERVSRWFLARAGEAGDHRDVAAARRWADAALAILPPADLAYWRAPIERTAARAGIPAALPPDADLAGRLAAWQPGDRTLRGGPPVADGDDALVALLGDPRPARAADEGVALAVGEVALLALAERWRGDPRWPAGRPDDTFATAEVLRDDAAAIQAWWRDHRADPAPVRMAALLTGAPPVALASRGVYMGFPASAHPAIGAALSARFARGLPSEQDEHRASLILPALLWFARDLDTAGWPDDPQHRQVRRLFAAACGADGAAAALLAASDLADPDGQGGPRAWQLSGIVQPQRNLGLIVYQPSVVHRTLLREARRGDLAALVPAMLAALAGGLEYPVLGDYSPGTAWRDRDARTRALAIDLAAEAAEDARPLPAELRAKVHDWARNVTDYELPDPAPCADLRICDWVVTRVLARPEPLDAILPADAPKAAAFLALPLAGRDALLPALRQALREAATIAAQATGLEAAPPSGF